MGIQREGWYLRLSALVYRGQAEARISKAKKALVRKIDSQRRDQRRRPSGMRDGTTREHAGRHPWTLDVSDSRLMTGQDHHCLIVRLSETMDEGGLFGWLFGRWAARAGSLKAWSILRYQPT